jgi:hypothetical protein
LRHTLLLFLLVRACSHTPKNGGRSGDPGLNYPRLAPVAQGIEQRFPKPRVGGSNPSRRASKIPANRCNRKRPGCAPGRLYTNYYSKSTSSPLSPCSSPRRRLDPIVDKSCSQSLVLDIDGMAQPGPSAVKLIWSFDDLLGAMYLQMYWILTSGGNLVRCEHCKRVISLARPHPQGRKRRRDKRFCDDACR